MLILILIVVVSVKIIRISSVKSHKKISIIYLKLKD